MTLPEFIVLDPTWPIVILDIRSLDCYKIQGI